MFGNPYSSQDVVWTRHFLERRIERDIEEDDVERALDHGSWEAQSEGDWRVVLGDLVVIISSDGAAKTVFRRGAR
jgi:membrane protein implicated in regulation of membrane protease activity